MSKQTNIEITEHDKFYWKYEYDVVVQYLLPLLQSWGVKLSGAKLLDVGCGDGGGVAALYDAGMICKGFDIEQRRVDLAHAMCNGRSMELTVGDIYKQPVPFAGQQFDLVVLHDVFEHLEQKQETLRTIASYLAPNGRVVITFPPFYSAFGGHQQLMRTWFARLPFVHLIPFMVSHVFPSLKSEPRFFVEEIQKLTRLRMGMKQFERFLPGAGLRIGHKQGYLVSPNHIRFGLKPRPNNFISNIPLVGEMLTSGVVYLLALEKERISI
jgi:2-polyprenyl-3-methyl-5-hydroxy-6-metoxy-1,4-benzoquinol methylase